MEPGRMEPTAYRDGRDNPSSAEPGYRAAASGRLHAGDSRVPVRAPESATLTAGPADAAAVSTQSPHEAGPGTLDSAALGLGATGCAQGVEAGAAVRPWAELRWFRPGRMGRPPAGKEVACRKRRGPGPARKGAGGTTHARPAGCGGHAR